jgi:hypothetical protein
MKTTPTIKSLTMLDIVNFLCDFDDKNEMNVDERRVQLEVTGANKP